MTETEWDACVDPMPMLKFLRCKVADRKLALFAVACERRIWPLLDAYSHQNVEWLESLADEKHYDAKPVFLDPPANTDPAYIIHLLNVRPSVASNCFLLAEVAENANGHPPSFAGTVADFACNALVGAAPILRRWWPSTGRRVRKVEKVWQSSALRCIFGPLLFRPITLDPLWLATPVLQLAESIYADRVFDRLPILADALEDAGCNSADILSHLRRPEVHVRGCWVIDLLTGRN